MGIKGDLLKLNLYLYIIIYRNMKSVKHLGWKMKTVLLFKR